VGGSWSTRREPTQTRGEHANSTQKGPRRGSNPEPSRCEATVLTTTPLCSPSLIHVSEKKKTQKTEGEKNWSKLIKQTDCMQRYGKRAVEQKDLLLRGAATWFLILDVLSCSQHLFFLIVKFNRILSAKVSCESYQSLHSILENKLPYRNMYSYSFYEIQEQNTAHVLRHPLWKYY